MPRFDNGASLQAIALSGTPLAHPPGYGVSFAVGGAGTVSPTTGAFVHPFTLLSLPSHAASMGLLLRLEYLSNALHSNADPQPFGHGFVLSGHDFLVETADSSQNEGATQITIFRGDGDEVRYGSRTVTSPYDWTYTGLCWRRPRRNDPGKLWRPDRVFWVVPVDSGAEQRSAPRSCPGLAPS